MSARKRIRLGDLLVEHNVITEQQLKEALEKQKSSGVKLGRVLVESGIVEEDELLRLLADQLKVPLIDLTQFPINPEVVRIIPEIHARRFRVIALIDEGDSVVVGMGDPTNIFAFDEVSRILKKNIITAVVRESDLLETLDTAYRHTEQISGFAEALEDQLSINDEFQIGLEDNADISDAPVVKLLDSLLDNAVRARASDIHIEPDEHVLRVRERVDGVLNENIIKEKRIASALIVRLKLMAGLDISEKRLPQDGRFSVKVQNRNIDIRLSTMPIYHGESAVLRLLDQNEGIPDLSALGMPEHIRERFEDSVQRSHGMVLVTGPTGSGKTTTLYSTLKLLNKPEVKIITVEDPVEYRLPRINQVQVNHDIDLGFARVLRTILRQDPDIVLIGEMRDAETVQIGLRAAMTGHMVLSTLHTNDAVSTAIRLLDMGAPGYLLATSLRAIIAQRLIRRICGNCKDPHQPDTSERIWIHKMGVGDEQYFAGRGCQKCHDTGYSGRIAVQELLVINDDLSLALASGDNANFMRAVKASADYETLDKVALNYARQGITTLEEVMRIAADNEFSSHDQVENELSPTRDDDTETLASDLDHLLQSGVETTVPVQNGEPEISSHSDSGQSDQSDQSSNSGHPGHSGLTLELVEDDATV